MLPWQPFLAFYIWGAHWRHLKNTTEVLNRPYAAAICQITLTTYYFLLWCHVCWCQAGGDNGEIGGHVKNYMSTSGGYRRRGAATSSGVQLNITNYNLPITVSYMNYLKQRKVSRCSFFSRALSALADRLLTSAKEDM